MGPNTLKLLNEWGADLVADVLAALASKNKIASGRLYKSLRLEVQDSLDELSLLVYEEDYGKYVDAGRGPGKMPPLEAIREWTRLKGIPERAAWPIARKIARVGTRPSNYFSVPLSVRLALLRQDLPKAFQEDLALRIREIAEEANKQNNK